MSSSSNRYSDQVPSAGIRFKRTTRVPFFQEQEPGQSFSSHQKQNGLRVVTLTWNVAGYSPSEPGEARQLRKELARELFCEDHADGKEQSCPDLIFLGFQEVVELKVKEVMSFFWQSTGKQVSNVEVWEQMVVLPLLGSQIAGAGVEAQQLASDDVAVDPFTGIATDPGSRSNYKPGTTRRKSARVGYKIVAREQLVGLVLWVVARCSPASRREEDDERQSGGLLPQLPPLLVTQCQVDAIRTAALGLLGTKGALVASIEIVLGAHNKTFTVCAVNVHLPSGEKVENVEERKAAVSQVFAHLGAATEEYDFFLFFGDLNARVNVNYGGGGGSVYGGSNNYPGGNSNFYGNGNGNAYAHGASATSGGRSAGVPPQQQLHPDRDDLACVLRKTTPLQVFEEGAVTFPPTFKYFRGGDDGGGVVGLAGRGCRLELNMQKSAPAWTDRVLFYSAKDRSPPPESCASSGARTGRTADLVVCSPPSSTKVLRYETSERLWHAIRGGSDHLPVVSSLALEFSENNGTAAGADPFASSATSRTSTSSQPPRRQADSVGVGQRFPTHQPLPQEPKTQQAEIVNRGQSSRGPGTAPPPVRAYELVVHPAGVFLPPDWDEFELMLQCTPGDSLLGIWSTTAQNGRGKGQNFKVSSYSLPVADYATSSGVEAAELPLWVGYGSQGVRFRRVGNGVSGGPWEDILLVRVIENKGSLEGAAGGVVYVAIEFDGG